MSFFTFISAAGGNTYGAVANYAEDYYNESETAINWLSEIVCVVFFISIPPTFVALNRSIHWTLLGAIILTAIGNWIRYVAFSNYAIAMLGEAVLAIGNVAALAMPPVLASAWFAPNEHFL